MNPPTTVLQYVKSLLPESYMSNVTSFCIVPDVPHHAQRPEIVVTTKHGELVEFRDRRVRRSHIIEENVQISEIILHHAKKSTAPTYILKSEKKVFIVGDHGSDELKIISTFPDVTRIELDDVSSTGEVSVRLWLFDDAIPAVLDGEYKVTEDGDFAVDAQTERGDERFASLLKSKMSEARYNTACNAKLYEEKKKFRQEILLVSEEASRYGDDVEGDAKKVDRLSAGDVWQRINCGKLVMGLPLENATDKPISDIELLMKCDDSHVFSYETHIYQEHEAPPFWIKKRREVLHPRSSVTVIVIAEEPQFVTSASVTLHATVRYKCEDKILSFSLPMIEVKAISLVNEEMNPVVRKHQTFGPPDVLTILATSVQTKLDIHRLDANSTNLQTFFVEKLKFSQNSEENSVLRHCTSSLHVLHGVALYISQDVASSMFDTIVLLSRSENQVLMLINLIYDLLPVRCVIVPSGYVVRRKQDTASGEMASEKMDISQEMSYDNAGSDLLEYASVINKQMSAVSLHLEKCLEAMSEANARNFSSKGDASMNIDVTALGGDKYNELWKTLIENMIVRNGLLNKILS